MSPSFSGFSACSILIESSSSCPVGSSSFRKMKLCLGFDGECKEQCDIYAQVISADLQA